MVRNFWDRTLDPGRKAMLMQDEMAGLGRRLLAVVIDMLMLKLLDLPLSRILREVTPSPIAALVLEYGITLVYCTIFLARRGQTPGKIMTSLRVISVDGGAIGRARAFVRSTVKWTPAFAILIVLSVLNPYAEPHQVALGAGRVLTPPPDFDARGLHLWSVVLYSGSLLGLALVWITRRHPDRQALHDRVSGTLVMRVG